MDHAAASHANSFVELLFAVAVVLLAGKLLAEVFERFGQPGVLGELTAGVVLGNLVLAGVPWFEGLKHSVGLEILAELGVVLLLFGVGIESRLSEMMAVGWSAMLAAAAGVIAPMLLGYGCSALLLPTQPWYVHLFTGATLAATSVGITARVLQDLKKTSTKEAQIVLGAAVVDDVLGLIVLAAVTGLVASMGTTGEAVFDPIPVAIIVVKSVAFLAAAVIIGRKVHVNALKLAQHMKVAGLTLALAVCFCFTLAALAGLIGLAPIVGAFAAGIVLEDDDYYYFKQRGVAPIHHLIDPINTILVPIFFVMMGLKVDLRSFASVEVLILAGALTVVAVIGKQICGLVVLEKGLNRMAIGIGMIPRGEVGLIFTSIGASLMVGGHAVLDKGLVSALVVMVMLTTVATPPLLKAAFGKSES